MELKSVPCPDFVREQFSSLLEKSYAPYSSFRVGCFLVDADENVFCGCNIENSAYAPTLCAERVAIGNWRVGEGKEIKKIFIIHEAKEPIFPCGLCRQVLSEFVKDARVYAWNPSEKNFLEMEFEHLLPHGFSKGNLE